MSEKKIIIKKNTPRRSKRAGYTGSKASLGQKEACHPEARRDGREPRHRLRRARAGCRWHCGLRAGDPRERRQPPPLPGDQQRGTARGKAGLYFCKRIFRLGERSGWRCTPFAWRWGSTATEVSTRICRCFRNVAPSLSLYTEQRYPFPTRALTLAVRRETAK